MNHKDGFEISTKGVKLAANITILLPGIRPGITSAIPNIIANVKNTM